MKNKQPIAEIEYLTAKAKELRCRAFDMTVKIGKGHLGGSFSCTEILVSLYYGKILNAKPSNPQWVDRDRFLLSKGHALNTMQILLADLNFFPEEKLDGYLENGSFLGGHVDSLCPGMDFNGGSLGHGLGVGSGMCLSFKISKSNSKVYVIIGDGECQEGSIWEGALFASHHELDNLTVFLDRNNLGSEDFTENICKLEPLRSKWEAFGWAVQEVDGHNIEHIIDAVKKEREVGKPRIIICHTIKGKGMSWCENTSKSHHTLPTGDLIESTRKELLS